MQIINLKQALNHGLVLKNVHSVIKSNQKAWLILYIDMNTELRKNANFENAIFSSWWIMQSLERLWIIYLLFITSLFSVDNLQSPIYIR